jgi:hypothetical protein
MNHRTSTCWCRHCRARRRRPYVIAYLLLATAALLYVLAHPQPGHAQPRQTPAPATTRSPVPRQAPPSASPTTAAGQGLSWVSFHGMQLPVSPTAGPRDTSGGLASGFTDNPRGALLAAINIGVRTAAQWGPAIFVPTITRQVTGPDASALLEADDAAYGAEIGAAAGAGLSQSAGQGYAAEVGYRFLAWSPASAVLDVVSAGPAADGTTVLASTRIQVLWLRGDWRMVAPAGGNWASAATAITSLTGYTPFPGER